MRAAEAYQDSLKTHRFFSIPLRAKKKSDKGHQRNEYPSIGKKKPRSWAIKRPDSDDVDSTSTSKKARRNH
jgi:hypothetical protein